MAETFLNLAYALMLAALLVREVFWLRILFLASQASFIAYALVAENLSITIWNSGFLVVNLFQVFRLLQRRRPISLSPELEKTYQLAFSRLSRREFLYFWRLGAEGETADGFLARSGVSGERLYFVREGEVTIFREGKEVARIGPGSFVADSSTVLDACTASIDAQALGNVRYRAWGQENLESLQQVDPDLFIKLQGIIGKYITDKLRAALDD